MTERSSTVLQCPLCDYETVFWDDETHWCPNCFNGVEPAISGVTDLLAMGVSSPAHPVIEITRELVVDLRDELPDADRFFIRTGEAVYRTLRGEMEAMSRSNPSNFAGSTLQFHGHDVGCETAIPANRLDVEHKTTSVSAPGHHIRTVHLPWEALETDD